MNEIEAYIRQSAQAHGIDPDIAVRVARSEGGTNDPVRQSDYVKNGVREQSYGPFQLYLGGGLGNRALNAGIDPRKPEQWREAVDFALAEAGKRGWGQWYGAARVGIGSHEGIGGATSRKNPEGSPYALSAVHPPNPEVGTGGYVAPGAPTTSVADATITAPGTPKTGAGDKYADAAAKALSGFGGGGGGGGGPALGAGGQAPQLPSVAPQALPSMGIVSQGGGGAADPAMLQAMLARLNQNRLWG